MTEEIDTYRGDDLHIRCTFTEDGSAYDLTDHTLFCTVKESITDSDDDAALTETITSFDAATSGIQIVSFSNSETYSLKPKVYVFDIQLKDDNSEIITVIKGNLRVLSDVTRRTS